jgi:flagellar assembly factor FliW
MRIETTRFGQVETAEDEVIRFRAGLIGFPNEKEYVLIPHGSSSMIAWLQSISTPELAFPVASAHGFVADYPDVPLEPIVRRENVGEALDDIAILAVLSAPRNQPATVNLLAPLIINSRTRDGVQVVLEGSKFSTRELFVVPNAQEPASEAEGTPLEAAAG